MNKNIIVFAMVSMVVSSLLYGGEGEYSLESVTVSANKIEENILDVPQSITVIDESLLQDKGIKSVGDVIKEIPNLSSSYLFGEDINFRGINASTFTNNNPIVLYIDGIPQSGQVGFDASLVNVERIEVLRGPQSTLYGKDAIGGIINIVTKKPSNEWKGSVGSEYATNNYMLGTFNINGPLVNDVLYMGFNVKASHDDGWITNHESGMEDNANEKNERRLGVSLLYKPLDRLSMRLNVSSDYYKNNWIDGEFVPTGKSPYTANRDNAKNVNYEVDTYSKTESDAQALNITYNFDVIDLTSVTTHKKVTLDGKYDFGWNNTPAYDNLYQFQKSITEVTSQELRLSSNTKEGIRWIGGLYAERNTYKNPRYGMQYPNALTGYGFDADMDDVSKTITDTQALFAQAIMPFADKYELTMGARYQHINKDFISNMYMNPVGTTGGIPVISLDADHDWSALLPKIALSYKVSDIWSTFASISKGYMPGGYNYWTSSSIESENRFGPQTSIDYEVGTKASFDKLYLAMSLFYMDIKDIHIYSFNAGTGMIVASNGGNAHSYGAELEFNYLINEAWILDGAFGIVEAKYDEYTSGANNGNKIEKTPSHTAKIGIQYNHPQGYYARFDVRNQGLTYFNATNSFKEGSYTVGDVKLGRHFSSWDIYTYVKNVTDKEYIASISEQGTGNIVGFGPSRVIGIGAKYTF